MNKDAMDMSNQYDNSSPLLYLPEEIWIQIFTYLSHGDLQQIKLVSTQWYLLSNAPKLKCKSKLVINYENASEISQFIKNQKRDEQFLRPLQYGNVLMKQIFTYNIDDLDEICKYLRPHVRLLQLTGLYSLGNHFVKHGYFPELQELNLSSAYVGAELDLRKFPKLKSLTLYSSVASLLLVSLETCQRLEKLVLFMDHDFGSFLEVLDKYASSLRCLEIRSPSVLQALDDQEIFKKYIRLEALHIKGPLSADYSHIFQNLPRKNLKTIELEPICNDDLLNLIVTKWSNSLQSLKLHFEKLTQRNAKQLNSISNKLSFLHLEFGGRVNKAFLNGIISETNTKGQEHLMPILWAYQSCLHAEVTSNDLLRNCMPRVLETACNHHGALERDN
uniref:F-box domain-containing protein n=1 Tax=Glossina brevipalpis TaxID=37001 RepID=A0A1A9WYW6_9MUSC